MLYINVYDFVDLFFCIFLLCIFVLINYKIVFFYLNFCGSIICKINVCFGVYRVSGVLKFI